MLPVTRLLGQGKSCSSGRGGWCRLVPAALDAAHAATGFGGRWKAIAARLERVPPCPSDLSSHPASPRTRSAGRGSRLVVTELSHIKELVKQLDVHLEDSPDLCKRLAAQIFTVTEKSIGMIMSGHFHFEGHRKRSALGAGLDSPPLSATPSPLSGVSDLPFNMANKKRKMMNKQKHQVRVSSAGGGAETPVDDGFSWRKYGQKDILGAQHPRGYYRCTYQKTQGCAATKQVQRTAEDPTLYDVIYNGAHTCVLKKRYVVLFSWRSEVQI